MATVLFADVYGFTALAERLDYEAVSDLLKEVWNELDAVIEQHGGYIDKHIGDAVMAVWGAPHADENDAERAVTAALALIQTLKAYTLRSNTPGAHDLMLRVGINTGPVLAGYVGVHNEYTVIGDTVNVANRLETVADPGTLLITESTYRLVRGMFQIRRLAPLHLKGKTEPVLPFIVEGELPGRMRYQSAASLETCMVARGREMDRLEELYRKSLVGDVPVLALVTGEAGLGKSRLLMEFTSHLEVDEKSFLLLPTRGLAQMARVPFYLWKTLLHNLFGLSDEDPPETANEKFLQGMQQLWGKTLSPYSLLEAVHLIGSLTGLTWPESLYLKETEDKPADRVRRTFELMREFLRRVCLIHSTVLVVDDMQWVDSSSLDLLSYLLQPGPQPLPMLIIGAARPDLIRQQPRWANVAELVTLNPLPVEASIVASAYPDLRSLPVDMLRELAERSDGNPYFLEEMVKGILKSGLGDNEWSVDELVQRLHHQPPESLRSMLQARLDNLSREARQVALLASVVGRVFWVGAVKAAARPGATAVGTGPLMLLPAEVINRVIQDSLRQLVRQELAFPRAGSRFADDQEYIFKHSLLREVAYSLIPHRYRMQFHLAVAQWMCTRPDVEFKVMAAEHYEQAGVMLESARQYDQAAKVARSRGFSKEAEALLTRAKTLRDKAKESA